MDNAVKDFRLEIHWFSNRDLSGASHRVSAPAGDIATFRALTNHRLTSVATTCRPAGTESHQP
jgi:hypothetical protein